MPSTQTHGGETDYEPSEYADDFNEDPAKILAKRKELLLKIIDGIQSEDLIKAVIEVEADRDSRAEIIGALNKRKQEIKSCPRGCSEPVIDRFQTADEFQIKHQNAVQYKTCIIPKSDGSAVVVFHHEPEPEPPTDAETDAEPAGDEEGEPSEVDDEAAEEPSVDASEAMGGGDDERDAPDLEGHRKSVYDRLDGTGSMKLAGIKGWAATELDLSPDDVRALLDGLAADGHVEEIEDAVYATQ